MSASIMIMGTGSDVGKSLIVAGLARALANRGMRVAPFKPQNMSNNAAVTADGGEIGRAQALQALAARVPASVHMNPVLLKPETTTGAQVVVAGKRYKSMDARRYFGERARFLPQILESYHILAGQSDIVLVEGAGSPAEINMRAGDIANMGFAEAADVPALVVGDIHRGGVIASLIGTLNVLSVPDAARIKGLIVNNFHGELALFEDGVRYLVEHGKRPVLGVVPHFADASRLPAEDSLQLERPSATATKAGDIKIAVPRLARMANFDDLDPLRQEPALEIDLVQPGRPLPGDADLVLIPGSKATLADLDDFRSQGWDVDLAGHVRRGGAVLGLCGGYQMLGRKVYDREGVEGVPGSAEGLALLDVETELRLEKTLRQTDATSRQTGQTVRGYEMHMGRTYGPDTGRPFADIDGRPDGAISLNGRIMGTYLHGLFVDDAFRRAFFKSWQVELSGHAHSSEVERTLDGLAAHLTAHLDLEKILDIAGATR